MLGSKSLLCIGYVSVMSTTEHDSSLMCRPAVVDTPELRSQYVRELLLSAFELGAGFS